jgi:hypothetical protein
MVWGELSELNTDPQATHQAQLRSEVQNDKVSAQCKGSEPASYAKCFGAFK